MIKFILAKIHAHMKVDRKKIVAAALDILNEVGVDRLSTRLIAERLNVQQPALYWHFKNKKALLLAMNEAMLSQGNLIRRPAGEVQWQDFLVAYAGSFRAALLAWRDGARVHAGTEAAPGELEDIECILALLVAGGMDAAQAMDLMVAIGRYTLGCVLEEQSEAPADASLLDSAAARYPCTASALSHYRASSPSTRFDVGLQLLIRGAEFMLERQK